MEIIKLAEDGSTGGGPADDDRAAPAISPSGPRQCLEAAVIRQVLTSLLVQGLPEGMNEEAFGGHAAAVIEAWLEYTWGGMFEFRGDHPPPGCEPPVLVGLEAVLDARGVTRLGAEYLFTLVWVLDGRVYAEGKWEHDRTPLVEAIARRFRLARGRQQ